MKAKSINAYIKTVNGKQHEFVAIQLDNGETVFVNTGLLVYAIKNAKPVKEKKLEQKPTRLEDLP